MQHLMGEATVHGDALAPWSRLLPENERGLALFVTPVESGARASMDALGIRSTDAHPREVARRIEDKPLKEGWPKQVTLDEHVRTPARPLEVRGA